MKRFFMVFAAAALCGTAVLATAACGEKDGTYKIYAPDGAPALALANTIAQGEDKFSCRVVDASAVQLYVTGKSPEADFCVLPVNLASKLLGSGETYRMLGTVTNGNLFFLTAGENAELGRDNLKTSLVGKTVGVVQLSNVPGLTLQAVLGDYEIPYSIVGNDGRTETDKVNLKATDAESVSPAGGCDYYLCPEPAASTKVEKTAGKLRFAGDLQELYGGGAGYPQAVLVAKKSIVEGDKGAVETLISYFEGSAEYLAGSSSARVAELLDGARTEGLKPSFTAENLTSEVIAHCSVRFTAGAACREDVNAFLAKLVSVNAQSASAVSDAFYYLG